MKKIFMILSLVTLASCNAQAEKKENKLTQNQENMKTIIVDVRTVEEWNEGHAECSVNYPLDKVLSKTDELKQYDKVVLVCRSGARAGNAKMQLESLGVKNIENLGAWQNVKCD